VSILTGGLFGQTAPPGDPRAIHASDDPELGDGKIFDGLSCVLPDACPGIQ
jgi:hypothetical protein